MRHSSLSARAMNSVVTPEALPSPAGAGTSAGLPCDRAAEGGHPGSWCVVDSVSLADVRSGRMIDTLLIGISRQNDPSAGRSPLLLSRLNALSLHFELGNNDAGCHDHAALHNSLVS